MHLRKASPLRSRVRTSLSSGPSLDLNQSFLTPENDRLPRGTYIATGWPGVAQLADYLAHYPDTKITRLLISDSTVQDMDTEYGYDNSIIWDEHWEPDKWPQLTGKEDKREDIWHNNATVDLRFKRSMRNLEAPLKRVLDQAAPSLEALTYLAYIYAHGIADHYATALLGRDYPPLTHLTFQKAHMSPGDSPILEHPSHFPAITHLHHDVANHDYDSPTLTLLLHCFPNLTHVLITSIGDMGRN
ncbi:hypothetical protein FB451DRAFT_1171085 [Mycena latifolia]|nr:hypothetical protein FB451DRAFT_1171085 [Mycena latifolia]